MRPMLLPQEKCRNGREYAETQRRRNTKSILHLNFPLLAQIASSRAAREREGSGGPEGRIDRPSGTRSEDISHAGFTGWRLPSCCARDGKAYFFASFSIPRC